MRRLRQLSMLVVLTLMLGTYALAGTIDTPPVPTQQPPPATATGIIDTPPSAALPEAAASEPVMDVVLDLMQSVLSLL